MIDQMDIDRPSRSIQAFKQVLSDHLRFTVLKRCEDKQEHTLEDLQSYSVWILNVTPEELAAQNKSKQETVLANRIRGVAYRLKRKGLLTSPSIGVFKIASKGLAILKNL